MLDTDKSSQPASGRIIPQYNPCVQRRSSILKQSHRPHCTVSPGLHVPLLKKSLGIHVTDPTSRTSCQNTSSSISIHHDARPSTRTFASRTPSLQMPRMSCVRRLYPRSPPRKNLVIDFTAVVKFPFFNYFVWSLRGLQTQATLRLDVLLTGRSRLSIHYTFHAISHLVCKRIFHPSITYTRCKTTPVSQALEISLSTRLLPHSRS